MALRAEVLLRKEARELELALLQKNNFTPTCLAQLEELLNDVYVTLLPKPLDYENRIEMVRAFNAIAKEIYGNSEFPVVEAFGSFVMDLFCAQSDLDLSINLSNRIVEYPRDMKIRTLKKFATKLHALQRSGHVSRVQRIFGARCPIIKVIDRGTGLECDVSVENRDGISKSHIVHIISAIDERFPKLSFLMKAWAKAQNINSSKDRTLNSVSIICLVAFHLQTCNPPILPPFSVLFKDGVDPVNVEKIIGKYLNYGKGNKQTVAELFFTLLVKLASVETLWEGGICASAYEGAWICKTWDSEVGCISVEDFSIRTENLARVVRKPQAIKIYDCIHNTLRYLLEFKGGHLHRTKLWEFLFGLDPSPVAMGKGMLNHDQVVLTEKKPKKRKRKENKQLDKLASKDKDAMNASASHVPILTKKLRLTKSKQQASGWNPGTPASVVSSSNRQRPAIYNNVGHQGPYAPQKHPMFPHQNPILIEDDYQQFSRHLYPLTNSVPPKSYVGQLHPQNIRPDLNYQRYPYHALPILNQWIHPPAQPRLHERAHAQSFLSYPNQHLHSQQHNHNQRMPSEHSLQRVSDLRHSQYSSYNLGQQMYFEASQTNRNQNQSHLPPYYSRWN